MLYRGSPLEALQRASEVLSVYWELVTMSDVPVDWRCQHEYTETFSSTMELSTESSTQHFTGGNYLLENRFMDCVFGMTAYATLSFLSSPSLSLCFFFFYRKLCEEISKDLAQKTSQRPLQAWFHHCLCLWRTSVLTYSLLSHYTKGTTASALLLPKSYVP